MSLSYDIIAANEWMHRQELVRKQEKKKKKKESDEGRGGAERILWELVTLCPGSEQKQLDQTSMSEGRE